MRNTIDRDIKMKEDVPSSNSDGKLPILDTKVWVEWEGTQEGRVEQICYELYEKPMVSRLVTMERSSLPLKTKITVLAQEVVRWMRNSHRGEERNKRDERMTKFMMKLKASGYNRSQRWEILKSGTRKYKRMVEDERRGLRRVNRPRWEGGGKRLVKKLLNKKNWFKKRGGEGRETDRGRIGKSS